MWVSTVERSCAAWDDNNKENACKPNIPAGIKSSPPSKTISLITRFGTILNNWGMKTSRRTLYTIMAVSILRFVFCFFCFFLGVAQASKRRFCSGICYFSVFLLPILLRSWGSNMLQRGDYAREICYFVVDYASRFLLKPVCIIYFSLLGQYLFCFFFSFFFGVAQAVKRRFCSGICYFLVFLLPIMLRFWGQICFKEAIMLVKYATLLLFTLPLSPCHLYVLFTYRFRLIYSCFSWRHRIFHLPRSHVVFNACMYACSLCMYVKYTFVCIPHRDIYHTLSGMVRSINTTVQYNTEQYVMLCCRCQNVKFSRPNSPEGNGRTADPLDVHTATILLEHEIKHRELKPHRNIIRV